MAEDSQLLAVFALVFVLAQVVVAVVSLVRVVPPPAPSAPAALSVVPQILFVVVLFVFDHAVPLHVSAVVHVSPRADRRAGWRMVEGTYLAVAAACLALCFYLVYVAFLVLYFYLNYSRSLSWTVAWAV